MPDLTDNIGITGPLVLFDGICNLCSASVQFLARRETTGLWYASVQSRIGIAVLQRHNLPLENYDSFVFLEKGHLLVKSQAALRLAGYMCAPWSWLRWLRVVPRPIADWIYDRIARNRYSLFGKKQSCMVPHPDLAARFLQ